MIRVQTLKVRLIKPLDPHTWDEVGPVLRDLSRVAHRALNLTMSALTIAAVHPELVPAEWKSRTGKAYDYPMLANALERINEERSRARPCKWCASTGIEPTEPPKRVVRTKAQPQREPGQSCSRCEGRGSAVALRHVEPHTAVRSGWARVAGRRHSNDRAEVLRGDRAISSFRSPAPIAITSSGEAFSVRQDGRGYVLSVPLVQGMRVSFALGPDGHQAYAALARIVSGRAKLGDCKLLAPRAEKRGWCAAISYSYEVEEPVVGTGPVATIVAGSRGIEIRCGSKPPRLLQHVDSIRRPRSHFTARRASRSRHQRDISPGARGHGRARALEHFHAVDDAEGRWLTTMCQTIAAKAVRHAQRDGASWIEVAASVGESKLLPPAQLQGALDWALSKVGFAKPAVKDLSGSEPSSEPTKRAVG